MLLVSSGFAVLFRIPEKQAHFFRVNSLESGLSPSSEELIYRFMKMFGTGDGHVGRKFPEQELHPRIQGGWLAQHILEGDSKNQVLESRVGCSWPRALPMGCGILHLKDA